MNLAPRAPTDVAAAPQPGTGVPCQVAQCDGVPCPDVQVDCEHCDRATNTACDEHRDATGDASSGAGAAAARRPLPPKGSHHA